MDPARIADVELELVSGETRELTVFRDLWSHQACVIIFLRRFG